MPRAKNLIFTLTHKIICAMIEDDIRQLWQIHFDIWQNQYNIVKFKNKIKLKKEEILSKKKKIPLGKA